MACDTLQWGARCPASSYGAWPPRPQAPAIAALRPIAATWQGVFANLPGRTHERRRLTADAASDGGWPEAPSPRCIVRHIEVVGVPALIASTAVMAGQEDVSNKMAAMDMGDEASLGGRWLMWWAR